MGPGRPKAKGKPKRRKNVYYAMHADKERPKALIRARKRKARLTPEELQVEREMHRLAQARYRERNRELLRQKALEYREKMLRQRGHDDKAPVFDSDASNFDDTPEPESSDRKTSRAIDIVEASLL
ncbi:hypothetical protein CVT26_010783 [Gymnopilus dilepis]|uniref:Uncharacterized protein n=1 Tax=Gymnopilus dilepis TaxID=231916 RepID=A0A409VIH7_9AGAR|nr:hypothetical protein CVT26_010783 [Gymnopilus dilepis]